MDEQTENTNLRIENLELKKQVLQLQSMLMQQDHNKIEAELKALKASQKPAE